jgi:hypothetical protein
MKCNTADEHPPENNDEYVPSVPAPSEKGTIFLTN